MNILKSVVMLKEINGKKKKVYLNVEMVLARDCRTNNDEPLTNS